MALVYITKYALTGGIFAVEANIDRDMISYRRDGAHFTDYAHAGEWHRTFEEAATKAEDMRKRKIASLQKSIAKMEKLTFGEPVA